MERATFPSVALLAVFASTSGAQTRYTVQTDNGVSWLRDAAGHRLFSFGVCVVDTGTKFEDYDTKNPGYAAWRFYKTKPEWASGALDTMRSGGFNTVGAWSDYASLLAAPGNDLKMTPILHNGSSAGFPWTDMWDPKLVKVSDDVAKGLITSLKRDPRIIGYFSDNELGWWRPALFNWVWKQPTHNTRHRAIALLRRRYKNSWQALTKDFDAGSLKSWSALEKSGALYLKPGAKGQPAIAAVHKMLAERYYSLCRTEIKRYDARALYLGDRYISNYYPEIASVAGKYCDVVSTNLNPNWTDGGFVRYHLSGLEKLTHKPLMVTEYYMSAMENRSGDQNSHSGFPVVATLKQRAEGFRNTTEAFLKTPYLVGAHWFQYYDEPEFGRGDGENYNFGLVDVNNQPYDELLSAAKGIDLESEHAKAAEPEASDTGLPPTPFTSIMDGPFDIAYWDRDRAFVPSETPVPRGDMYVTWKKEGLEVRLYWSEERFIENYYRDGKVPKADRTRVNIELPQGGFNRYIDASETRVDAYGFKSNAKYDAASCLSVFIPAAALGETELKAGSPVKFKVTLVSETKAYTTVWNLKSTLAN